jgi:hypothetical protein
MLTTEQKAGARNPAGVHFQESRVPDSEAPLDGVRIRREAPSADGPYEQRGVASVGVLERTDAELSWALATSTPLAVFGATLLAFGSTVPSDLCLALGAVAILAVFLLQAWVRWRVRHLLVQDSLAQGFPLALGRKRAKEYLNSWFQ